MTSSLSMLQPSMAFIEEAVKIKRKFSTLLLGVLAFFISGFVVYFSEGLKAMDTFDFWMGQVAIYLFAIVQTVLFAWYFGAEKGMRLANEGSQMRLPKFYAFVIKYITPVFLIGIFLLWLAKPVYSLHIRLGQQACESRSGNGDCYNRGIVCVLCDDTVDIAQV